MRLRISPFYTQGKPNFKDFPKLWKLDIGYISSVGGTVAFTRKTNCPKHCVNDNQALRDF